jgi:hypothetical protein
MSPGDWDKLQDDQQKENPPELHVADVRKECLDILHPGARKLLDGLDSLEHGHVYKKFEQMVQNIQHILESDKVRLTSA